MPVASNQKVVPPVCCSLRSCGASARLARTAWPKCRGGCCVRRVARHLPPLIEQPRLSCIFGDEVMQNRNTTRRKIVTHIIDVRQFFLFTTIGVQGGEPAKPRGEAAVRVRKWTARVCRKLVGDVKRGWVSHACSLRAAIKHEHAHGVGRTRRNPAGAERRNRRRSRRSSTSAIAA